MLASPHSDIYCLRESTAAHPALNAGIAPVGLLAPEERLHFERFKVPKRRRDWLLGRWTAKHLVRAYLQAIAGDAPALDEIVIAADTTGAPYARLAGSPAEVRLPLSLSISHSGSESFCALCESSAGFVGADIEFVEPREKSFVRAFFTPAENEAVERAPAGQRDLEITAFWSVKEAVLKTLRLGLRADTRQVTVTLPTLATGWLPVPVLVDPALLTSANGMMSAWVQPHATHVLSLTLLILQ